MFGIRGFVVAVVAGVGMALASVPADAQSLTGTHSWQMQPYCNVVTMTLVPTPGGARLEGTDNLCGAADRGSVLGMASFNAAGQVTLNFTIVTAPAGRPVHVTAIVSPQTGNGFWTDSGGTTGNMAYATAVAGLPVRPVPITQLGPNVITTLEIAPGAVNGSDINPAEVQTRVAGSCPAGQAMTGINANGTVTCTSITGGGGSGTTVAFKAGGHQQNSGSYLPNATFTDVTWTGTTFNIGGGTFNTAKTEYTVPTSGLYLLTTEVRVMGHQTTGTYCGGFRVNGTVVGLTCNKYITTASVDTDNISTSTTVQLSAGDVVSVGVLPLMGGNGLTITGSHPSESNFTVTRLP